MKICLIGSCPDNTPLEALVGYSQVLPYWLREGFRAHGHESFLFSDKDLGQELPPSDVVIVMSAGGLIKLRRDKGLFDLVARSTSRVCELTDGPSRSIMDWGRVKFAGAYYGLGGSPEHLYPERSGPPVILFNGWNLPLDNPKHEDPLYLPALEALKMAQAKGWQVWSMNAAIPWADRCFGKEVKGRARTNYVPWVEYCAIMRQGSIFFDTTNKIVELGRIEAAVAGNVLVSPRYNQTTEEWIDGVRYLHQIPFDETDATEQLEVAMKQAEATDPLQIQARALEYFSWPDVTRRILDFLEVPKREMGIALSKRQAVVKVVDGKEWQVIEEVKEDPATPPAAPSLKSKSIPWVSNPLHVPPSMLYYQAGAAGPKPVDGSLHATGAYQVASGWDPLKTDYAQKIDLQGAGCQGDAAAFGALVRGMKKTGWKGPGIIGWINRRGEVVIHDGWHRSAAALALGLETIPVRVHARDEDWIAFRHAVADLNNGRKLYQPILHPDFDGWPCWRKDTKARIAQISVWLKSVDVRTVTDLGCHAGTITHGLARLGYEAHGVDQNPKAIEVAKLAGGMTDIGSGANFNVANAREGVDATVCLSAINHALVTDQAKADAMLADIRVCSQYLVTDCPTPGDPVGGDTDWSDPEKMIAWLEVSGWRLLDRKDRGAELQRTLLFLERS